MVHQMGGGQRGKGLLRPKGYAVTLFELLVVLVVASILTVLFVYSAQYLMVSSRVSRVQEEHRVLTRALQNYEADYGSLPSNRIGLHALCAPVAYMVRIPADPFSDRESDEYLYVKSSSGDFRWVIVSAGPDHRSDLLRTLRSQPKGTVIVGSAEDRADTLSLPAGDLEAFLPSLTYDPTNGLVSGGDIITIAR